MTGHVRPILASRLNERQPIELIGYNVAAPPARLDMGSPSDSARAVSNDENLHPSCMKMVCICGQRLRGRLREDGPSEHGMLRSYSHTVSCTRSERGEEGPRLGPVTAM